MKGERSGDLGRHQETDRLTAPVDATFSRSSLLILPRPIVTLLLVYASSSACPPVFFG